MLNYELGLGDDIDDQALLGADEDELLLSDEGKLGSLLTTPTLLPILILFLSSAELEKDVTSEVKLQMRAEAEEWAQEQLRKHKEQQQVQAAAATTATTTGTATTKSTTSTATTAATSGTSAASTTTTTTKVAQETAPAIAAPVAAAAAAGETSVVSNLTTVAETSTAGNASETTSQVAERAATTPTTAIATSGAASGSSDEDSLKVKSNQTVNNGTRDALTEAERVNATKAEADLEAEVDASDTDAGGLSSLLASSQESLPSASSVAELPDPREDEEEREERTNFKTASERADNQQKQQQHQHQQHSLQQQLQRRHHTGKWTVGRSFKWQSLFPPPFLCRQTTHGRPWRRRRWTLYAGEQQQ